MWTRWYCIKRILQTPLLALTYVETTNLSYHDSTSVSTVYIICEQSTESSIFGYSEERSARGAVSLVLLSTRKVYSMYYEYCTLSLSSPLTISPNEPLRSHDMMIKVMFYNCSGYGWARCLLSSIVITRL